MYDSRHIESERTNRVERDSLRGKSFKKKNNGINYGPNNLFFKVSEPNALKTLGRT